MLVGVQGAAKGALLGCFARLLLLACVLIPLLSSPAAAELDVDAAAAAAPVAAGCILLRLQAAELAKLPHVHPAVLSSATNKDLYKGDMPRNIRASQG